MIQIPSRRAVLTGAFGIAMAVGVTFGTVACSSTPNDQSAPATSATSNSAQQTTAAGVTDVMAGAEGVTGAATPYDGGVDSPANGVGDTVLATPAPVAPVSTAGPTAPAGSIDDVVAEAAVTSAAPVALADTADFGGSVSAALTSIDAVDATAKIPGEVGGPAVAVTVQVTNGSGAAIGMDNVTVTLTDSAGNPASTVDTDSSGPLAGALGAGGTAKGQYVFSVPTDLRNPVTITVTYSSGAPTLVFTGAVSGG